MNDDRVPTEITWVSDGDVHGRRHAVLIEPLTTTALRSFAALPGRIR